MHHSTHTHTSTHHTQTHTPKMCARISRAPHSKCGRTPSKRDKMMKVLKRRHTYGTIHALLKYRRTEGSASCHKRKKLVFCVCVDCLSAFNGFARRTVILCLIPCFAIVLRLLWQRLVFGARVRSVYAALICVRELKIFVLSYSGLPSPPLSLCLHFFCSNFHSVVLNFFCCNCINAISLAMFVSLFSQF